MKAQPPDEKTPTPTQPADAPARRTERPLKILLITETFLPKVDGVVTRLTATLAELTKQRHRVLVLAPPGAPTEHAEQQVMAAKGLPFPWYPEHTAAIPTPKLAHAARTFAPDIVHVVNPVLFGAWGIHLAHRLNAPLLASFHTDPKVLNRLKLAWFRKPLEILNRELHNHAHVNLATSPQMIQLARSLGIRRVRLWQKAVDSQLFNPHAADGRMRRTLTGGDDGATLVLHAGRISHEKRVDTLAEAILRLSRGPHTGRGTAASRLRFAIVGDGPARRRLEERLAGTPTTFTGFLAANELAAAYASSDLLAFPSDAETLGFAALEAMAAGTPAVAANAGGIPHIVQDGATGLLFPPGDSRALAERIARLASDPTELNRLSTNALQEARRWTWNAATEDLTRKYKQAIRLHGSRSRH